MECSNTIEIRGPIARIYDLAAKIEDWPRILPHYRYVRVEEKAGAVTIARMGAARDGFPVSWRARQELRADEQRILFQHIGGVTKGMEVEWRLEPVGDTVRVTIFHALTYPVPILGPLFADRVVGRIFVSHIAGKTLACIKRIIETETGTPPESGAGGPR